jgi:hypothetical protein
MEAIRIDEADRAAGAAISRSGPAAAVSSPTMLNELPTAPVVEVLPVARYAHIGHSQGQRPFQTEGQYGIPRNSDGPPASQDVATRTGGPPSDGPDSRSLSASSNGSNDGPQDGPFADMFTGSTVVTRALRRLDAIGISPDRVTLTVHDDRFQVEDQVVVGSNPDHQLDARSPRNGQTTTRISHVLLHQSGKDATVASVRGNGLVCADWHQRTRFNSGQRFPIAELLCVPRGGKHKLSPAPSVDPNTPVGLAPGQALFASRITNLPHEANAVARVGRAEYALTIKRRACDGA